jgi:hypothetical protein
LGCLRTTAHVSLRIGYQLVVLIENCSGQIKSRTSGQSIKCIQISGKFPNQLFGIDLRTKVGGGGAAGTNFKVHTFNWEPLWELPIIRHERIAARAAAAGAGRGATGGWSGVATGVRRSQVPLVISNHCSMEVATNALFMTYWK